MNAVRQRLDFWTCFFLNSEEHFVAEKQPLLANNLDQASEISTKVTYNLYCNQHGAYIMGADTYGLITFLFLFSLLCVLGIFGVVTNLLNIIILGKSFQGRESFKEALILLSWIELVLSIATMGFACILTIILGNWDRSLVTMQFYLVFGHMRSVSRTMSVYITFLITIAKFVVVAFPLKSSNLISDKPWKSRATLAGVMLFCLLLNLHKYGIFKYHFVENRFESLGPRDNVNTTVIETSSEILGFPYIPERYTLYNKLPFLLTETMEALDYIVPLPLLLLFNGLLYFKINRWSKERSSLKRGQNRDLSSAKMFSVIATILLACHLVSSIVFIVLRVKNVIYRELIFLQGITMVFGTSSNFIIYYWFGHNFRKEFWGNVGNIFGTNCSYVKNKHDKFSKQPADTKLGL